MFPDVLRDDLYDVDAVDVVGGIHNSSATTNTAPNNVVLLLKYFKIKFFFLKFFKSVEYWWSLNYGVL